MFLIAFLIVVSLLLITQGILTLIQMLYAWDDPSEIAKRKSPTAFLLPQYSFTALIPARREKEVISDTIRSVAAIDYPDYLKEILIICRTDDIETILQVQKTIDILQKDFIRLIIYDTPITNKPHALNHGLSNATKDVVVVFDAEDEPHRDIYSIVNTVMLQKNADVVQSGVQLMNYRSHWFSPLNVLEYFFWFKSSLQFFAQKGFVLLGGNTVFIKRAWLSYVGGWDELCLTEDADIGIRLSAERARTEVIYDQTHTTREETPHSIAGFIRQRTRWNQGFLQVLFKGNWLALPTFTQKFLAFYALVSPLMQSLLFLYLPISLILMIKLHIPILLSFLSIFPLYILLIQLVTYGTGLYEFTRDYHLSFPFSLPVQIVLTFFPFQLLLGVSTINAIFRLLTNNDSWEKTTHTNIHRLPAIEGIPLPSIAHS